MGLVIQSGHFGGDERIVAIRAGSVEHCLDLMKKEDIRDLSINDAWGWDKQKGNLNFLYGHPWVEGVMIADDNVDVTPLNTLQHLKRLKLPDKYTGVLDFKNFPKLEKLFCRWNKRQLKNLGEATSLQWASFFWINEIDLSLLKGYKNLKRFKTCYSKIHSLKGIEHWSSLEKLELWKLPRLSDISALLRLRDHFKHLTISGRKSFSDYAILENLWTLKSIVGVDLRVGGEDSQVQ